LDAGGTQQVFAAVGRTTSQILTDRKRGYIYTTLWSVAGSANCLAITPLIKEILSPVKLPIHRNRLTALGNVAYFTTSGSVTLPAHRLDMPGGKQLTVPSQLITLAAPTPVTVTSEAFSLKFSEPTAGAPGFCLAYMTMDAPTVVLAFDGVTELTNGTHYAYNPLTGRMYGTVNNEINYDGGTGLFTAGQIVTGATSGATATILLVEGDDLSGRLWLGAVTGGPFQDNEALSDPVTGAAVAQGANGSFTATSVLVSYTGYPIRVDRVSLQLSVTGGIITPTWVVSAGTESPVQAQAVAGTWPDADLHGYTIMADRYGFRWADHTNLVNGIKEQDLEDFRQLREHAAPIMQPAISKMQAGSTFNFGVTGTSVGGAAGAGATSWDGYTGTLTQADELAFFTEGLPADYVAGFDIGDGIHHKAGSHYRYMTALQSINPDTVIAYENYSGPGKNTAWLNDSTRTANRQAAFSGSGADLWFVEGLTNDDFSTFGPFTDLGTLITGLRTPNPNVPIILMGDGPFNSRGGKANESQVGLHDLVIRQAAMKYGCVYIPSSLIFGRSSSRLIFVELLRLANRFNHPDPLEYAMRAYLASLITGVKHYDLMNQAL